jgi:FkbM family methyltransferase
MERLSLLLRSINEHPLARKNKLHTFYRIFRWQLSQFIFPRTVIHEFIGSTKLLAKKGMAAATANIYFGLHEFNEMGFLLHFLRREDTFVDVGANVGSYTILASGVVGSRSIAAEPVPVTFEVLKQNIQLNNLQKSVLALNIGIGSHADTLFFTKDRDSTNRVVLEKKDNKNILVQVPVRSLDEILLNEQCPSLIKIDVEGFEQEVINGASKILQNNQLKAVIIELNGAGKNYGFNDENIHQMLMSYNFSPHTYNPLHRKLEKLETYGLNNTIYLRDKNYIKERIATADTVNVFSDKF